MSHDLVIRGGSVVDGTGAEPYQADVAVEGERIVEIGKVDGKGKREIDAAGLNVSPGFIDLHTHLDAQIGWDRDVTSVSWHGVTTALFGNCGVTFAPCKATDREFLAGMMETVEDIPKQAILHGLPWNWESYGGYLDALDALGPAINICGLVGHCATRFYVMGERAVEEPATEDEIRQIAELAGQSVKEGAVGFSTNRLPQHRLPDGRSIPGTFADRAELRAVAKEVGAYGGIMQTVSDFREFDEECDLIADEARMARGALFSCAAEIGTERLDKRVTAMRAEGLNVTSVTVPRSGGGVGGLSTNNFFRTPAWMELRKLDLDGRVKAIRDPETRQRLVDEVKAQGDGVINAMRRWFYMGDAARPCYTQDLSDNLPAMAEAAGEHPVETWLRLTDETNGRALFHMRGFNVNLEHLEKLITTDWAMPGLGDAGAHVSQMIDSGWSTFILSHWHRDSGVYSLQEAVRRISAVPAHVLGLEDRGTLALGKKADINVFDIDRLEERMPKIVHDFPFGAPRFIQRAAGYHATVCNGSVILCDDELTGEYAGRVLRSGA
ncbi:MAG: amidohydrolase family protein [Gammaproteobacteria bacterium]|nr:amidohydrolase family protein [Gammaproteobacteria bacterium]MYJ75825.1 amidohydrolase family protein [Gammaproteobacteria bacterium]